MTGQELALYIMGLFTWFVAVPIYVIFLYMLIRFRNLDQFNTPFYHLVFQCGLLDLWYVLHEYVLVGNFLVNLIPGLFLWASVPIATIIFYGYFYIRACQAMSVLGISLNRFTAIISPLRHELLWTKTLTRMTIVTQHVVAALLLVPAFSGRCFKYYIHKGNGSYYILNKLSPNCVSRIVGPSVILVAVVSVILIVLYFAMFLKVRHSGQAVGQGNQSQKAHRALAVGGSIISGTLVLNTLLFFCLILLALERKSSFSGGSTSQYASFIMGVFRMALDTLFCIVNPFVLLLLGTKLRTYYWKCVKQIFCIKQQNQPVQVDVHHLNININKVNRNINRHNVKNRVIDVNL